jgi:hypothetical protein
MLRKKHAQFFDQNGLKKTLKRTQTSPIKLKFQKVHVCNFQIFAVYVQNGVTSPRLMGYVMLYKTCKMQWLNRYFEN